MIVKRSLIYVVKANIDESWPSLFVRYEKEERGG